MSHPFQIVSTSSVSKIFYCRFDILRSINRHITKFIYESNWYFKFKYWTSGFLQVWSNNRQNLYNLTQFFCWVLYGFLWACKCLQTLKHELYSRIFCTGCILQKDLANLKHVAFRRRSKHQVQMGLNLSDVLVQMVLGAIFDKVIKPEPKLYPIIFRLNAGDFRKNLCDRVFTFCSQDLTSLV